MAYVVAKDRGTFELRESRTTPRGPRSFTLCTFKTLTPEAIEHARQRATAKLEPAEARRAARRAGAPVALPASDSLAIELLRELEAGRRPKPRIERMLRRELARGSVLRREPVSEGLLRRELTSDEESPASVLRDGSRVAQATPAPKPLARPEHRDDIAWVGATPQRHGEALRDVLLFADSIPSRRRTRALAFPRIDSSAR